MIKAYKFVYLLNIILGLVFSFLYFFIINYQLINILFYVLLCLFYIFSSFKFFRNKKEISKLDYIVLNIFLFSLMGLFVYNMIYQGRYDAYSLLYYDFYIYCIHMIYIIYNYCK